MEKWPAPYGMTKDRIHPFFMQKREWSKVKDKIVGKYVSCYLKTIQHRGVPVTLVDAFSGPGRFGDGLDGSPLMLCKLIDKNPNSRVPLRCIFSDAHPEHRKALTQAIREYIDHGVASEPLSDVSEAIATALESGKGATLFFYLDPWGIKDIAFEQLKQIFDRDRRQSTEVLINFSFRTFMRMSGHWKYSDSASEVAQKVRRAKLSTLNAAMGGDYWVGIVTNQSLDKIERENQVVQAYVERLRPFFSYVYPIPVKERDPSENVPVDEIAKYHLIFGTRSARAVRYMNDVALGALTPYLHQFKDGLLFEVTPARYAPRPVEEVKEFIVEVLSRRPMKRPDLYEVIVPRYFLQRQTKEYRAIVDELTFVDKRIFADPRTIKVPSKLNNETMLSTTPWCQATESAAMP